MIVCILGKKPVEASQHGVGAPLNQIIMCRVPSQLVQSHLSTEPGAMPFRRSYDPTFSLFVPVPREISRARVSGKFEWISGTEAQISANGIHGQMQIVDPRHINEKAAVGKKLGSPPLLVVGLIPQEKVHLRQPINCRTQSIIRLSRRLVTPTRVSQIFSNQADPVAYLATRRAQASGNRNRECSDLWQPRQIGFALRGRE